MDFSVKSGSPEKQRTACLVLGVYEPRKLSPVAEQIDKISNGFISNIVRRGDIEGKLGQVLLLHNVPGTLADRVLLVGVGRERDLNDHQYRKVIATAVKTLNETGSMEAHNFLCELHVKGRDMEWKIRHAVEEAHTVLYTFDQFKSKKDSERRPLRKMIFNVATRRELSLGEKAIAEGEAISHGSNVARDLANMPGNICHPTYLANQAIDLANKHEKLTTEILEESDMLELGMGAFMSVSQGSEQPGKMIIMHYRNGPEEQNPTVLVGKGITFDTGGVSIKGGEGMDEMKYDMGGAAAVFGTMVSTIHAELPINLTVIIAAAENMPDGKASRPGDIVTSMSGQTIEILNTDAEGRLVLCDALTYAERFNPDAVIDVATLTGACIIALGHQASAVMGNHNPLTHELMNASEAACDRAWKLPLFDEYHEQLESNFADFTNLGGRAAGSITAGCFLSKFTKKYHWAHIDIAGTAWRSGKDKGATGRPVPMLTQYLIHRCENQQD
jgi:leucyl aminopeptidase